MIESPSHPGTWCGIIGAISEVPQWERQAFLETTHAAPPKPEENINALSSPTPLSLLALPTANHHTYAPSYQQGTDSAVVTGLLSQDLCLQSINHALLDIGINMQGQAYVATTTGSTSTFKFPQFETKLGRVLRYYSSIPWRPA